MNRRNQNIVTQGVDYVVIWLYAILVAIGILCIFMVEYRPEKTGWLRF